MTRFTVALSALTLFASVSSAQTRPADPSTRLRQVLPPEVAERVLATIADARAHELPATALENRALKFAAKGVEPAGIERSVTEQAARMDAAKTALLAGRRSRPAGDEIEAGAEAMRKGVDGAAVAMLARSAPSGRSLAVPLFVIGTLTERGVPSSEALQRVLERLKARASDAELESMPGDLPSQHLGGQTNRPSTSNRDFGHSHKRVSKGRPATAGPPGGIPGNAGKKVNPAKPPHPSKAK
ncbi:MAG TPA: hypothetical protein VM166_00705 [Gemmatimonadaceae bacterium]|nr:hypothetical protein [Gemmatimonadaceae bacterium]